MRCRVDGARGAALVTVLMIVALASVTVADIVAQQHIDMRLTRSREALGQARYVAQGAERWAAASDAICRAVADRLRELARAAEQGDTETTLRYLAAARDSLARLAPAPDPGAETRKSIPERKTDDSNE